MDDLSKIGILQILSSMGVHIPQDTKLSTELLADVLNAAQNRDKLPITPHRDPETVPKWPVRLRPPERESVMWAVWRGSEVERNSMLWAPDSSRWREDPFWVLRQTMTTLVHTIDLGYHWVMIRDPTRWDRHVIVIRLLPTLQVDVGTPAMVVVYMIWDSAPVNMPSVLVFNSFPVMNIHATPLEMMLMLYLLNMNKHLLPRGYRAPVDVFGWEQKVSILLPIGPLGFRHIDRLGNDPGCVRCGNGRRARCSQCQSVSYCSATCQWNDWPAHRPTCLSLKGGKWRTIPFRVYPPGEGGLAPVCSAWLNLKYRKPWTKWERIWPKEDDLPPPNIHGVRTFLVKMQAPLVVWIYPAFLIYDEQHSFDEVFFYGEDSPEVYAALIKEVQGPRGGNGGNMYRWARRTGQRELLVCFDKEPEIETKW